MPRTSSLTIHFSNSEGQTTTAVVEERTWTKADANGKALQWGGGVFLLGLLMIPIPIVHFGIIPLYLFGLPMALVTVYKLYSGGSDISGTGSCPSCSAPLEVRRSSDDWPLSGVCPACRKSYLIQKT